MKTIILCLTLAGCASGVQMSDAEREACEREGCTVWTRAELTILFNRGVLLGFEMGNKSI